MLAWAKLFAQAMWQVSEQTGRLNDGFAVRVTVRSWPFSAKIQKFMNLMIQINSIPNQAGKNPPSAESVTVNA
jgi:hypothetical protein